MTDAGWVHILVRHREMVGREDDVRIATEGAGFINHDADRVDRACHYQPTGPGRLMRKVAAEYRVVTGQLVGSAVTAYPTGKVRPEEARRWP